MFDFTNRAGDPAKGIITALTLDLKASGLKHEVHTQYHRTESQWLEYQMLTSDKVRPDQR